jgi:hypothetical protein
VIAGKAVDVEAIEVIAAQLAIRRAVAEQMVGDHQDAVGHRDDGLLVAAALDQAAVLGAARQLRAQRLLSSIDSSAPLSSRTKAAGAISSLAQYTTIHRLGIGVWSGRFHGFSASASNGVFALHASQPSARRVYQPAALS